MDDSPDSAFDNAQRSSTELPDYAAIEFEPVAPTYGRYVVWSTLAVLVPAAAVAFVIGLLALRPDGVSPASVAGLGAALRGFAAPVPLAVAGGLLAMSVLILLARRADARYRGWALREHDLAERHGIFWRSVVVLPFARIQHAETSHGPIERSMDLARLKLYTAGGMTADLTVLGMDRETADRVREHLVEQIRLRDRGSGEGGIRSGSGTIEQGD